MTGQMCPLCSGMNAPLFANLPPKRYFRCETCALVFLDPMQRPSPEEERAEYDLHENDPTDMRYRKWLSKLTDRLVDGVPANAAGLDFGCGPGPTISVMLGERGFSVANYDPIYAPDRAVLGTSYSFIACTETAEHFYHPGREFALLHRLLQPEGRLGIMTQMLLPHIEFATWRYRLQPSHVAFYSPETMTWIAEHFDFVLELHRPDVALFTVRAS